MSFRLRTDQRAELDAVAKALDRDRNYLLNQTVDAYLEVHRWQLDHLREAVRQADAGESPRTRRSQLPSIAGPGKAPLHPADPRRPR